jgi:hypothetical protein
MNNKSDVDNGLYKSNINILLQSQLATCVSSIEIEHFEDQ